MKKSLLPHLALFSVALIYGANYTIAKSVFSGGYIPALAFIFFRIAFGMIVFQIISAVFIKETIDKKDWGRFIVCGLLGSAINQMFFFLGLERTTPIHASLIMLTTPFVVVVASSFLIRERITVRRLIGICLGGLGAMVLLLKNNTVSSNTPTSFLTGDLMIFINASSYGLYLVLVKPLAQKYHAFTIVAWVFTFGAMLALPIGAFYLDQIDWPTFTPNVWLAFGYVLVFTTLLAYLLNAYSLTKVSPSVTSVYIYLQPLIAGSISIMVGNESLNWQILLATALIFAGVYLVSRPQKVIEKAL